MKKTITLVTTFALFAGLSLTTSSCATYHRTVIVKEDTKVRHDKGQKVAADRHFKKGIKFYSRGKYIQAIKQFQKSLAQNPGNWEAQYYLGMSHRETHDFKLAKYRLELALHQAPRNRRIKSQIHTAFGLTYERAGQPNKAIGSYELALEFDVRNAKAQKGLRRVKGDHHSRKRKSHG